MFMSLDVCLLFCTIWLFVFFIMKGNAQFYVTFV